jgi:hypothetical protein
VTWQAPASATTPSAVALTLTVVEKYQGADDRGLPIARENRTTERTVVDLHDSVNEVSQLARLFLLEFSDSNIRAASLTRIEFNGTCPFRDQRADACAQVPVDWDSTVLDDNSREQVVGTDQVTAVYDAARRQWGLCASDFNGRNAVTASGLRFIR